MELLHSAWRLGQHLRNSSFSRLLVEASGLRLCDGWPASLSATASLLRSECTTVSPHLPSPAVASWQPVRPRQCRSRGHTREAPPPHCFLPTKFSPGKQHEASQSGGCFSGGRLLWCIAGAASLLALLEAKSAVLFNVLALVVVRSAVDVMPPTGLLR